MSTEIASFRVVAYYRVSTARQAERELSIPDQQRHAREYCASRGWNLVDEFTEPGISGTDSNRPQFRRMLEAALSESKPFDAIVVHSFSRFARDVATLVGEFRSLKAAGVRLIAMTQEVSNDPEGELMRTVMGAFDGYQSAQNAKHTLRAMKENARRGYWNGARAPDGYKVVDAGRLGDKTKRKLELNPVRAPLIRKLFDLALEGDGAGPMGVKAICCWLNEHGHRTQTGGRWGIGTVHVMLTKRTYIGEHIFNHRDHKTKKLKAPEDWVKVEVPPLIDAGTFDAVQRLLKSRNPRTTPPRITNSPCFMTGVIYCESCGQAMTLRTGKGGKYRYYSCATRSRFGATGCAGRSIRMDLADRLVSAELAERILSPERIGSLVAECVQRASKQGGTDTERRLLQKTARDAEAGIQRLYEAIAAGTLDPREPTLKQQIDGLQLRRSEAGAQLKRMDEITQATTVAPSAAKIRQFSDALRQRLQEGDITLRKAYLRALVDRIVVGEREICMSGRKAVLASGALSGQLRPVPSFVPKWCARRDSNSRPPGS